MKTETGSSASFASRAAAAGSVRLASAALTAFFGAAPAACFVLVGLSGGEHSFGEGELGVGAGFEKLQLAHGRRRRRRLARRYGCGGLCLVGRFCGLRRLPGEG